MSIGFSFGSSGTTSAAAPGSIGGIPFGTTPGSTGGLTQPASTGGLNLGAKPATQAGGFTFGSATPSSGFQFGKPAGSATSTPQTGGFAFGSVTSSGVSFGAPATPSSQAASSGLKLGGAGKLSTSYSCKFFLQTQSEISSQRTHFGRGVCSIEVCYLRLQVT